MQRKIIFYFIFSLFSLQLLAQKDEPTSKNDTIPEKWYKISGFRAGIDVIPLISKSVFKSKREGFEALLEISLQKKYFIETALGVETINFKEQGGDYQYENQGLYFRAGFHHNLLFKDKDEFLDVVFFGFNVGFATFTQNLDYNVKNPVWGERRIIDKSPPLNALWTGLNFGVRVETFKNFFLGWTANLKVRLSLAESQVGIGYIPGFGINDDGFNFGAAYTIMYQIPFTKRQKSNTKLK